ncbi:hypothetical protein HQ496_12400, partial [bacterium]|nr:hypothetical protein [bacterium]
MIESIHIVWLALFGLLTLVFGAVGGFLFSKIRLHRREVELGEEAQRLREQRVKLQREAYQTSTSTFHKKSEQENDSTLALSEMLKQREHELSILEHESQMELRILREQNEMLQEELNEMIAASYSYGHHVEPGLFEDVHEKHDVDEAKEVNEMEEKADNNDSTKSEPIQTDAAESIIEDDSGDSGIKEAESDSFVGKNDEASEVADEAEDEAEDENEFAFHWTAPPTLMPSLSHVEDAVAEPELSPPTNPVGSLSWPVNSEEPAIEQKAVFSLPVFKHVVDFVPPTPQVPVAPPAPPVQAVQDA